MRIIPTRVHGIIDYIVGLFLIAMPWLLGFAAGGAETWVPVILGAGVIIYSLLTDYEMGAVPTISMTGHLWMDAVGGLILAASPWIFGFWTLVWVPHLVMGVLEIGAAAMTELRPTARRHRGDPATSPRTS